MDDESGPLIFDAVPAIADAVVRPGLVDLDDQPALRIELFDQGTIDPGSEPDQMLGVTNELFDSPCTVREPIESTGARQCCSVVMSPTSGSSRARPAPARTPNA